jgi:hypothetical protein
MSSMSTARSMQSTATSVLSSDTRRQFLDRPDVVAELLALSQPEPVEKISEARAPPRRRDIVELERSMAGAPSLTTVPGQTTTRLPTLSILSPRTHRLVDRLPPPDDLEQKRLGEISDHLSSLDAAYVSSVNGDAGMYRSLQTKQAAHSADPDPSLNANFRPFEKKLVVGSVTLSKNEQKVQEIPTFVTASEIEQHRKPKKRALTSVARLGQMRAESSAEREFPQTVAELRAEIGMAQADKESNAEAIDANVDTLKTILPKDVLFKEQMKDVRMSKALDMVVEACQKFISKKQVTAMTRWKWYVEQLALTLETRSARIMQRCIRIRQANEEIEARLAVLAEQKAYKQNHVRKVVKDRILRSIEIQRVCRGHRGRIRSIERRKLLECTWKVQMCYRASRASQQVAVLRAYRDLRFRSARDIQRVFRGHLGRVRSHVQAKILAVNAQNVSIAERRAEILYTFQHRGAAMRIQLLWKRKRYWKNLRDIIMFHKKMRMQTIEQWLRMFAAKLEMRRRKKRQIAFDAKKNKAGVKLEAFMYAYRAVRLREQLAFKRDALERVRIIEKEVALAPKMHKSCLTGSQVNLSAKATMKHEARREKRPRKQFVKDTKAAVKIQKIVRRYRVRARVMWVKQLKRQNEREEKERRLLESTMLIQRVYRGYCGWTIARNIARTQNQITVSKVIRGFLARRLVFNKRKLIAGATSIQRYYRGHVAYKSYQDFLLTNRMRQKPALQVQTSFRRLKARKELFRRRIKGRRAAEMRVYAVERLTYCRRRSKNTLILDSAYGPRSYAGEIQDVFEKYSSAGHAGGSHSEEEKNRMLVTGFVKFFKDIPGVIGKKMSANDVELMFTKVCPTGEKHIDYEQFISSLDLIASTMYSDTLHFDTARGKRARMLRFIVHHLFEPPWAKTFTRALEKRTDRFIYLKVSILQGLVRGRLGRLRMRKQREEHKIWLEEQRRKKGATAIQTLGRRYLARSKAIKRAKKAIVKYIDPATGEPYWSNPSSGRVMWKKPKIFGKMDVDAPTVLPDKSTEYLVPCVICSRKVAQQVCLDCDDAFCQDCFDSQHTKGNRRKHVPQKIPQCAVCHYQMGSRVCNTCTFEKNYRFVTCDVCFHNSHRDNEFLKRPHKWAWMVVSCVECQDYAARWRCNECDDLYCTECFSKVHSKGTKVEHTYIQLSYFTRTLYEHFQRDIRERARRDKEAEQMGRLTVELTDTSHESTTVIQKHWRARMGRIEGHEKMREVRRIERKMWKLRQEENRKRRRILYRWRDSKGRAPPLESDTLEEQILKKLKPKKRIQAKYFIEQNVSDDGHFAELRADIKKAPKTGFDVGSFEDLWQQAVFGGIKLPGTISVDEGARQVTTSVSLLEHVKEWDRVRIGRDIFDVSKQGSMLAHDETNLPLVQVFRGVSTMADKKKREGNLEDGHIYLMPPRGSYDRRKDNLVRTYKYGTFAQVAIRGRVTVNKYRGKFCNKGAKQLKKMGYRKSAAKWKKTAARVERRELELTYITAEHARKAGSKQIAVRGEKDGEGGENIADQLAQRKAEKATDQYLGGEDVLESQWEEKFDVERQKKYWVHKETGETTFEEPKKSNLEMTSAERELEEAKKRREEQKAAKEARKNKKLGGKRR